MSSLTSSSRNIREILKAIKDLSSNSLYSFFEDTEQWIATLDDLSSFIAENPCTCTFHSNENRQETSGWINELIKEKEPEEQMSIFSDIYLGLFYLGQSFEVLSNYVKTRLAFHAFSYKVRDLQPHTFALNAFNDYLSKRFKEDMDSGLGFRKDYSKASEEVAVILHIIAELSNSNREVAPNIDWAIDLDISDNMLETLERFMPGLGGYSYMPPASPLSTSAFNEFRSKVYEWRERKRKEEIQAHFKMKALVKEALQGGCTLTETEFKRIYDSSNFYPAFLAATVDILKETPDE